MCQQVYYSVMRETLVMAKTKTKYPRKHDATCIVCEDIRVEKSDKLILIGVYPANGVNFKKSISQDEPGQINLAFCFWFHNCLGEVKVDVAIRNQKDESMGGVDLGKQAIEKGKSFTIRLPPKALSFTDVGIHKIIVTLDSREYEFPLMVTASP
jgi:hypothetical protein